MLHTCTALSLGSRNLLRCFSLKVPIAYRQGCATTKACWLHGHCSIATYAIEGWKTRLECFRVQCAGQAVCMPCLQAPSLTPVSQNCFVLHWAACLPLHDKTTACTVLSAINCKRMLSALSLASYWSCSYKPRTASTGIASCIDEALCWSAEWA